ncbi:MAG TPA: mycofactocin-coupled SDR family oxidoreductase [Acidimicrobiales bacterium]|jgi:SDR family mycofactocin-dependent oxidoreductase|nr:mycofactocin-coupled SDR family oxidoreductase [Acidimicrobiales bacterium]
MSRVALVTGAARGIGAATVLALAGSGWSVVAVDRAADDPRLPYPLGNEEQLRAVVVSTGSEDVLAHLADTTDPEAMRAAVARAEEHFGGLDAVIAAAGVIAGGVPLWEMPEAELRAVLETDLYGPATAARAGIPALLRRPTPREGRFIAVVSAAATRGLPGLAAYGAAKAGVAGLVRGLAVDLRGTGVTAVGVSPGSTATPLLAESARLYGLPDAESFAAQVPVERLLSPQEVARTIVWLAGPDTGGITGAVLPVDGGLAL